MATVLRVLGPGWLAAMGTDPQVLPLAAQYLSIRCLATPAVLVMNACQGACLGQQDTLTPMWVCLAATALNLVGDMYLVWVAGMGVAGAALATAGAQVCAAVCFLYRLHARSKLPGEVRLRWTVRSSWHGERGGQ